jgi:hypothetical protein
MPDSTRDLFKHKKESIRHRNGTIFIIEFIVLWELRKHSCLILCNPSDWAKFSSTVEKTFQNSDKWLKKFRLDFLKAVVGF